MRSFVIQAVLICLIGSASVLAHGDRKLLQPGGGTGDGTGGPMGKGKGGGMSGPVGDGTGGAMGEGTGGGKGGGMDSGMGSGTGGGMIGPVGDGMGDGMGGGDGTGHQMPEQPKPQPENPEQPKPQPEKPEHPKPQPEKPEKPKPQPEKPEKPKHGPYPKPPPPKPTKVHYYYPPKVYRPKVYQPVYKPVSVYYCLYFYYHYGYYPGDWYVYMKEAVDDYQKTYGGVYGCSFSDIPEHYSYNWGYDQYPDSQGGYICFKYKTSPDHFWGWLYGHPKYAQMGFAYYKSDYCHYKVDTLYTLPKCEYTY